MNKRDASLVDEDAGDLTASAREQFHRFFGESLLEQFRRAEPDLAKIRKMGALGREIDGSLEAALSLAKKRK